MVPLLVEEATLPYLLLLFTPALHNRHPVSSCWTTYSRKLILDHSTLTMVPTKRKEDRDVIFVVKIGCMVKKQCDFSLLQTADMIKKVEAEKS